jgi:hypothetical protein
MLKPRSSVRTPGGHANVGYMTVESSAPGTPNHYRRPIFWLCVLGIGLGILSVLLN